MMNGHSLPPAPNVLAIRWKMEGWLPEHGLANAGRLIWASLYRRDEAQFFGYRAGNGEDCSNPSNGEIFIKLISTTHSAIRSLSKTTRISLIRFKALSLVISTPPFSMAQAT